MIIPSLFIDTFAIPTLSCVHIGDEVFRGPRLVTIRGLPSGCESFSYSCSSIAVVNSPCFKKVKFDDRLSDPTKTPPKTTIFCNQHSLTLLHINNNHFLPSCIFINPFYPIHYNCYPTTNWHPGSLIKVFSKKICHLSLTFYSHEVVLPFLRFLCLIYIPFCFSDIHKLSSYLYSMF